MTDFQRNILFGVGALIVVGFLLRRQAVAVATAIANVNEGTPFEDTGPIGTLGNVTDTVLLGVPSTIGSAIGEFFSGSFFDRRTLDELTGTVPVISTDNPNFVGPPA